MSTKLLILGCIMTAMLIVVIIVSFINTPEKEICNRDNCVKLSERDFPENRAMCLHHACVVIAGDE